MAILRVRNIPLSQILRFGSEEEPLNLVDITGEALRSNKENFLSSPGNFIYESRFTINEIEAFSQGVTGIRFEFFASKPGSNSVPLRENDFTIEIKQPPVRQVPDPLDLQRAAIFLKAPDMSRLSALAEPTRVISKEQPLAKTPFKQESRDSETNNKRDPAHALSAGRVLGATPSDVLHFGNGRNAPEHKSQNFERVGVKAFSESKSLAERRNQLSNSRKQVGQNSIIDSFLNLKKVENPRNLVRTIPVVMVEVLSNHVEYTRQFSFDKTSLLGFNKIYLRVSGIVKDAVITRMQPVVYKIAHASEVGDFLGNPEPPVILSSESSFGKVSFILKRTDPTLRKVAVIRITKNPNLVNSFFENVGTVEFGERDTVTFADDVDNVSPNTVIYRFIVQNDDGSCGEFVSSVLTSYTKVTDQKKVLTSTTPISIRAINTNLGIQISVDTINDQVYSLRLLRQDMGAIGEFADTVTTILDPDGRYSQIIAGEKRTISFLDQEVVQGRHYRYFAAYRLGSTNEARLCQETISDEDETIVRTKPSNTLPFSADITPAIALQDDKNFTTVQFELSVQETEEQYNMLFDALQKAGVSQQLLTDLQNDRQKMRQVAAFLVERVDRVTGRRASFGIFAPGKFFDSADIRSKLGIPDPLPGRKYEYICKLCIRPPSTFMLSAVVGFVATNDTSGNITNVLASKFQNALIQRGILPSEKQLRDGTSIRENFFLGLTGLEISTEILLPEFGPKIENINVKERKYYNLISWNATGDLSKISYFLVYCNYNGTDELMGSISSVGKSATYQFKDSRFCYEVGQKSYFVRMVTLDHDVSIPSPKVEIVTNFSIPEAVLDGFILSPSRYEVNGVVIPGPGPRITKFLRGPAITRPATPTSSVNQTDTGRNAVNQTIRAESIPDHVAQRLQLQQERNTRSVMQENVAEKRPPNSSIASIAFIPQNSVKSNVVDVTSNTKNLLGLTANMQPSNDLLGKILAASNDVGKKDSASFQGSTKVKPSKSQNVAKPMSSKGTDR